MEPLLFGRGMMREAGSHRLRLMGALVAAGLAVALLALVACASDTEVAEGGQSPDAGFQQVTPSDRVFTFGDFETVGIKHGKDYDVEGLPGATAAVLAFYDKKDVEIRFFPSHDVAVAEGIPVAREIIGADVHIKLGSVTWPGAIPDERACAPGNLGGGRDCTRQPKYGDFIVYGNVIMFCEGKDSEGALQGCRAILDRLLAPSSG